jgi:hypothetical protein
MSSNQKTKSRVKEALSETFLGVGGVELGSELRASRLLGRCSTTWVVATGECVLHNRG